IREDFYEALTEFGMCLKIALGSRSFYEDTAISEKQIAIYKEDLKFFTNLRQKAKQDAQETVDFSAYEKQIRQLVDKHVVGEEVKDSEGVYLVNDLGLKEPSEWSEEKLRNETDLIKSRLKKTIEQELTDDPYAQIYFSELLKLAIQEAEALFEHPFKQFALFDELEQKAQKREIDDIPKELSGNKHACAYFGVLRIIIGQKPVAEEQSTYVDISLKIDRIINESVAENSLNFQNIETAIRKGVLPVLFKAVGLENAKRIIEKIIEITRVGLSRGDFNG
ncbi:MAG: type I restriction endonuclease subunit R, partial [Candidatus Pacebacteria bacterium]|nr:type I restriction endonuclease subunit R [Candidatus Paceibacterota bacterium]